MTKELIVGLVSLFSMIFKKKSKVDKAVEWLAQTGLNLAEMKALRVKIDQSADRSASGNPEELVLTVAEVKLLDDVLDNTAGVFQSISNVF